MKYLTAPALLFVSLFIAAQSYTLTVTNGYGSGTYNAGDTVHVWSAAIPANHVFDKWTGDISFLVSNDEWHTQVVMPAQNISVTANFRNIGSYTVNHESIMGRDTLKEVYSYFPPNFRGVIFCFHGTGGAATNWVTLFEYKQFLNDAVADSFAFIITEAEEITKQTDLNANGKLQWNYLPYDATNIDFANISILIDTFTNRGLLNANTKYYAVGMSNGGAFASTIATYYNWTAAVSYCAQASQLLASTTTVPIQWCMAAHDEHPNVGPAGNAEALNNHNTMVSRGICSKYFLNDRSPVYPERFMRSGTISQTKANNLMAELQANNLLDANNYLLYASDTIAARILASPTSFLQFLSLPAADKVFMSTQVDAMYAAHQFYSDYNKKTLKFFRSLCEVTPAGIADDERKGKDITVFPNPFSEKLEIRSQKSENGDALVEVFDVMGRKLLSEHLTGFSHSISTDQWQAGIYFVKLGNVVKKVVKE